MRNKVVFYLNGLKHEVDAKNSKMMLAEYLRVEKSLTGTKIVCSEGDCGACSVLKYFPHHTLDGHQKFLPINSCLTFVAQCDGASLITIDALKKEEELNKVQSAMMECHGSQCGFCTPGFVVTLSALVDQKLCQKENAISEVEAKNALTGNLCRCTGYKAILDAAAAINITNEISLSQRFYSKDQENELKNVYQNSVLLESDDFLFFAPKSLKEALDFLKANPETKILAAATDLGVLHNKRIKKITKVLSLHLIDELYRLTIDGNKVIVGARVTITQFRNFIKNIIPEFASYLDIFASPQIKNVATLIGNIANASPIGDTPPALLALKASVSMINVKQKRRIELNQFFKDYRKTDLAPGEIITDITFDVPKPNSKICFLKNSNRKDLDISSVNFAMHVEGYDKKIKKLQDITIAAGGVAAVPLRLKKTEDFLKNKVLDINTVALAVSEMHKEFSPISDHRSSKSYRRIVLEKYFYRALEQSGVEL